jgi:alginate O-acetyltransferase complex protein AlgI
MIFNTWVYGAFFVLAFAVHWLSPRAVRPWVLIACGLFFYGWYHPPHLPLVLAVTLVVWALGRAIAADAGPARRLAFVGGVAGALGLLAYYKYSGFFLRSLGAVVPGVTTWVPGGAAGLAAPLAISFFTFEFVHYLIEVRRGSFGPASLRDFLLFIFFFPTLVCGPIKRFGPFHAQEKAVPRLDPAHAHDGLARIVVGLAKKTLGADLLAPYAAPVLLQPDVHGWGTLWLATYAYAFQIYLDFAGYSDIAIGSARLLGYTVPENFDWPYLQPNVARFWRSWHMSLTSWITDYVYVPLGGSRGGPARATANRVASMALCGLWHGAAFHFVAWGLYHGVLLALFRLWETARGPRPPRGTLARAGATPLTFHVVCVGWVLFVCDVRTAVRVIGRLLGLA